LGGLARNDADAPKAAGRTLFNDTHIEKGPAMTTPGPPGWYDDPQSSDALQYWDGQQWTGRLKPKISQPASEHTKQLPRPDQQTPASDPPYAPPRAGAPSGITIGAIVAIAVISIACFLGYKFFFATPENHQVATGPAIAGSADEDQIKNLVQMWTDDFNNRDLAGMRSLMCSGAQLPTDVFALRDKVGNFTNQATNIVVTGDQATAVVTSSWSGPGGTGGERFDNTYAKENGNWRICHTVNF
jgi:hypothetical protein